MSVDLDTSDLQTLILAHIFHQSNLRYVENSQGYALLSVQGECAWNKTL